MKHCKNCRHWGAERPHSPRNVGNITEPVDPDTYEAMVMPFQVRECGCPELLFCERPLQSDGFAVCDGSTYLAGLFTGEDFACIMHDDSA